MVSRVVWLWSLGCKRLYNGGLIYDTTFLYPVSLVLALFFLLLQLLHD